jgi:hypothetical protein
MGPTRNAEVLRPTRDGYVFEAVADGRHWVFAASPSRDDLHGYRPWRRVGQTRIRGRSTEWLQMSDASGIHGGHLALTWSENARRYVVSAHARPGDAIRTAIGAAARDMRPV